VTEKKVFLLLSYHAAVLNVVLMGPENLKRKKVEIKKNIIKKSRLKTVEKTQKKLKSLRFNYQVNKKKIFMI
jgi:hypothetical protein